MKARIIGSIVHTVEKPKQYLGMFDIYTDEPPLFIPFSFVVLDNQEFYPHILFFDEPSHLFLDADCRAAPEDMNLNQEQFGMYQILVTSVGSGILHILAREPYQPDHGSPAGRRGKRRWRKKVRLTEDIMVPFTIEIASLDKEQIQALIKLSSGYY